MRNNNARRTRRALPVLGMAGGLLLTILVFLGSVSSASPGNSFYHQTTPTPAHYVYLPQIFKSYFVPPTLNYRFGFGMAMSPITAYDPVQVAQLRAGIYTGWTVLEHPTTTIGGMEYIQIVRLRQAKNSDGSYIVPYTYTMQTSWDLIARAAAANPGAIWLVGNEIDGYQRADCDEITPELYAQAYHETYKFIKQHDPTALVGIGGIIQATPLRFMYLERVLATYESWYGQKIPVDVWNVHGFILREKRFYPGCPDCWGADVPPGFTQTEGELTGIRDTDNLDIYKSRLIAFRQWMKDKGERDKPLIVSEYGPLMPDWVTDEDGRSFTEERYTTFLYGSFDFMQNATDSEVGCPADKNHLVQQWMWYSLDCDMARFGGRLFHHETKAMTQLGLNWVAYMNDPSRAPAPHVNLFPLRLTSEPSTPFSTGPVTLTLQAEVANSGSLPLTQTFKVRFYDQSWEVIGDGIVSSKVRCCGGTTIARVTWTDVPPGAHQAHIWVDPDGHIPESDKSDNWLTATVLVASYRVALPLVLKGNLP